MIQEEAAERRALVQQAMDASTREEWNSAWDALLNWKRCHPEDQGIEDAFEMLAPLRLANEEPASSPGNITSRRKDGKRREEIVPHRTQTT